MRTSFLGAKIEKILYRGELLPYLKPLKRGLRGSDLRIPMDHRGLAYATDRVGAGLFILEYTGGAE